MPGIGNLGVSTGFEIPASLFGALKRLVIGALAKLARGALIRGALIRGALSRGALKDRVKLAERMPPPPKPRASASDARPAAIKVATVTVILKVVVI